MHIACLINGVEVSLEIPQEAVPAPCAHLFRGFSCELKRLGFVWGRYSVNLPLPITRNKRFVFECHSLAILTKDSTYRALRENIERSAKNYTTHVISKKGLYGELTLGRYVGFNSDAAAGRIVLEGLAKSLHDEFAESLVSIHVPEAATILTKREREILAWTAEGKTAAETAMILNLSAPTIAFHLKNVMEKLNCANKIQAAVKATSLGILRN